MFPCRCSVPCPGHATCTRCHPQVTATFAPCRAVPRPLSPPSSLIHPIVVQQRQGPGCAVATSSSYLPPDLLGGEQGRESKAQIAPYPPQLLTWHGCQRWEMLVWLGKPLPHPTVITGCFRGSGASCNNSGLSGSVGYYGVDSTLPAPRPRNVPATRSTAPNPTDVALGTRWSQRVCSHPPPCKPKMPDFLNLCLWAPVPLPLQRG